METAIKRLNWGCGGWAVPGWINSDIKEGPGIDISCDIRDGLPLEENSIEYIMAAHALPEISYPDLVPTLQELRRVLKPGATLRLSLPDLLKGVAAFQRNDVDYFLIPDEEVKKVGAKLIVQLIWYGYSRTLFTPDFIEEMLLKAGFSQAHHCEYQETKSGHAEIVDLDNRENESLFIEAVK